MAGSIKVNGIWKTTSGYYVKVNGIWKTVTNGYVKVNGIWKQFHSPAAPSYYAAPVYYAAPQYYGGGGCTYYTVTSLSGLTVSQATNSITGSGNVVGSTSSTSTTDINLDGTVASQSPSSGLYCGQQTVSFTYYTYTPVYAPTYSSNPCGVCGDGGTRAYTYFYCLGSQRWSKPALEYKDACGNVCNTIYDAPTLEVSCSPNCNCGIYYAPTYYAAPVYYTFNSTYFAAPQYYTAPVTYYSPPVVTYYAAPIYYTFNSTYFAAPIYYTAPVYYTTSGGGCWAYGTPVTLFDGSTKPIEEIVVGDVLRAPVIPTYPNGEDSSQWYPASAWSVQDLGELAYEDTVVTKVKHVAEDAFYLLNDTFKVTGDHFVFVKKGSVWQFARVDEVAVGDFFKDESGNEIEVTKKSEINEATMVVDIDVEDNDLFFANGIITHNFKL